MSEAFWGAVVGGALTVVGGLLGSVLIRWRDNVAAERARLDELIAAVRVVRYEIAQNSALLAVVLSERGHRVPVTLEDAAFREVRLRLARGLPSSIRVAVIKAYGSIPIAQTNIDAARRKGIFTRGEREVVEGIRNDFSAVSGSLNAFLTDTLKVADQ